MAELETLLVHAQGEIGKVIVSGAPEIPGATVLEKMNHINEVDESLRRFACYEPRAHVAMTVNLPLPPTRPDADAGFILLQADRAHPMSGSNAICVVTALLETGRVKMTEPETPFGGTFTAEAIGETTVGPLPAVLPRITGSARVLGRQ